MKSTLCKYGFKSISKKEDVKPLAKQNEHQKFTNPKASIIYHAVPGKGKPVAKAFPNKTKNEYVIKPQNFIVMVHTFFCSSKGHNLQSIQAIILTKAFDGKGLSSVSIPAGYCEQCNRYYILSSVYEEKRFLLKNALCDFVKDSELSSYLRNHEFDSNEFRSQSILNRCGYSVSRNSLLTRSERIQLLESIITNGVLSREEVKSFINWLIRFQGSNPIMYRALIEWEIDLKSIARDSDSVVVLVKQILS